MAYWNGTTFLGDDYDFYSDLNAHQVAPEYSSSATYAVGDYCIYDAVLYRCTTAITTAEAWTAAHWSEVKLGQEVTNLKEDLSELFGLKFQGNTAGTIAYTFRAGTTYYIKNNNQSGSVGFSTRSTPDGSTIDGVINISAGSIGTIAATENANYLRFNAAINGEICDENTIKIRLSELEEDTEDLGNNVSDLTNRVNSIEGNVIPVFTNQKYISWVDSTHMWTYGSYQYNASIEATNMIHLEPGDTIKMTDYTGVTYDVYYKKDVDDTYARNTGLTSDFTVQYAGDYAINTQFVPGQTLTPELFKTLVSKFIITRKNAPIPTVLSLDKDMKVVKDNLNPIENFIKSSPINLINQMTIMEGFVISGQGVITQNDGYAITAKMYLKPSTVYSYRNCFRVVYFNDNDERLSSTELSAQGSGYEIGTFTAPAGLSYAIIALSMSVIYGKEWQLVEGDTLPDFQLQHLIIDGYRLHDKPDVPYDPIETIENWDKTVIDTAPLYLLSSDVNALSSSDRNVSAIYSQYDALMASNTDYITKTELGDDGNGVTLYRYDFKTPEYSDGNAGINVSANRKTKMILVSGIHPEFAGIYCLYHALERITNDPVLEDIKSQMHFIVMPVINAYACNGNAERKNHNGIDLARNFEVGFTPGTNPLSDDYSGTTALSEVEDQYVDAIMSANTDAIYFASCHNFQSAEVGGITMPNFNMWGAGATLYWTNIAAKVIDKMSEAWIHKYGYTDVAFGSTERSAPNGSEGKQAMKYGIQGGTFEVCKYFNAAEDGVEYGASAISRGTEVYVNMIRTAMYCFNYRDKIHQLEA